MASLDIRPLADCDIDPAYALVRLGRDQPSLEDWRAWAGGRGATGADGASRGAMTARRGAGALCGVAAYRRGPAAPALRIERLVAFDLTDPEPVARALMDAVFAFTGLTAADLDLGEASAPGDEPIRRLLASPAAALHRVL